MLFQLIYLKVLASKLKHPKIRVDYNNFFLKIIFIHTLFYALDLKSPIHI